MDFLNGAKPKTFISTSVYMNPEFYQEVKKQARKEGYDSYSEFVKTLLSKYMEEVTNE